MIGRGQAGRVAGASCGETQPAVMSPSLTLRAKGLPRPGPDPRLRESWPVCLPHTWVGLKPWAVPVRSGPHAPSPTTENSREHATSTRGPQTCVCEHKLCTKHVNKANELAR